MDVLGAMASEKLRRENQGSPFFANSDGLQEKFATWRASFARSTDEALNQSDPFGNGDQRTYNSTSKQGTELISTWSEGADASIWQANPLAPPLEELVPMSLFMRACALGDLATVKKEIISMKASVAAAVVTPIASASEPVTTEEAVAIPVASEGKRCSICQLFGKEHFSNSQWSKPDLVRKCKSCAEKAETAPQLPVIVEEKKKKDPPVHPSKIVCKTMEELLERREFMLRMSPLLSCIAASRAIGKGLWSPAMERDADHLGVAKVLLEAGANVHAKDIAGYTPLHHSLSAMSSPVSLRIGLLLLQHSANVKATTRVGRSVGCDALMQRQLVSLKLALEGGYVVEGEDNGVVRWWKEGAAAATRAKERFGSAAHGLLLGKHVVIKNESRKALNGKRGVCLTYDIDTSQYTDGNTVQVLCDSAFPSTPGSEEYCVYPPCEKVAVSRCKGCRVAAYCSRECETKHWKTGHEVLCRMAQDANCVTLPPMELLRGPQLIKSISLTANNPNAQMPTPGTLFTVKVQVPSDKTSGDLYIYSEGKKYHAYLPASEPAWPVLNKSVREKGLVGLKAYFRARMKDGGEVMIDANNPLPIPKW